PVSGIMARCWKFMASPASWPSQTHLAIARDGRQRAGPWQPLGATPVPARDGRCARSQHLGPRQDTPRWLFAQTKEGGEVWCRRFDFYHHGIFDRLKAVQHALGMPADIAGSHDEGRAGDDRFHLATDDVGNRFVGVGVQRRADPGGVADLQEGHFVALNQRLYRKLAAIGRFALYRGDPDFPDVGISRANHCDLLERWPFGGAPLLARPKARMARIAG